MKRIAAAALIAYVGIVGQAGAQTFTSRSAFLAANPATTTIEDFESVPADQRDRGLSSLTRPNITFTTGTGGQDVYVYSATPASGDFAPGVITTASAVLTGDGLEHFVGTLAAPDSALGFDVLTTDLGNVIVRFYSGATVLDSITFPIDGNSANNYTFAGLRSTSPITGFAFDVTSGINRYDSGIDNVLAAPFAAGLPEPAGWAMMIAGAGIVGGMARRRRIVVRQAVPA